MLYTNEYEENITTVMKQAFDNTKEEVMKDQSGKFIYKKNESPSQN
jgi:hypothetical protein